MKKPAILISVLLGFLPWAEASRAKLRDFAGGAMVCYGEFNTKEVYLKFPAPLKKDKSLPTTFGIYSPMKKGFVDVRKDLQSKINPAGRVIVSETRGTRVIGALTPMDEKNWQYNASGQVWNCRLNLPRKNSRR
ncbi:MAG: hypothetical protein KF802_12450 [Bdellovibrionaceae bacterium]|nr:hypothetical protein [Pseudobdellovibrionaceae bacterium]